jgi:predicted phosphodiesterase
VFHSFVYVIPEVLGNFDNRDYLHFRIILIISVASQKLSYPVWEDGLVRIAAIGDAHLGRSAFTATTPDGVNQRERDFEESFLAAIDRCLLTEPDLMVWLGDVFDHPRPSYRSFRIAMSALARIRDAGVRLVAISGNHDTPRLPGTGNPYAVLDDAFPQFHFAYRMAYEAVDVGDAVIHCVPQTRTSEDAVIALQQASDERSLDKVNVLITHPLVQSVERRYPDINEIEIDEADLRSDHVLLGHYHVYTKVRPQVHYAGSTDTFSFGDVSDLPKGIVLLDTETGSCTLEGLSGQRQLITPEPIYAFGLSAGEVEQQISTRLAALPHGSVARLVLDGVSPEAHRLVDLNIVGEASRHLLHYRLDALFDRSKMPTESIPELASLVNRWRVYAAAQLVDKPSDDIEAIVGAGHRYLEEAIETAVDVSGE